MEEDHERETDWPHRTNLVTRCNAGLLRAAQSRFYSPLDGQNQGAGTPISKQRPLVGRKPNLQAVAQSIIESTNQFRTQNHCDMLRETPQLSKAANYYAKYMAQKDRNGHYADGNTPRQRAEKYNYSDPVAENVAWEWSSVGFATDELAKRLFEGWKDSPGHCKNMLRLACTDIGVAVAQSRKTQIYYAVQLFGPASAELCPEAVCPGTVTEQTHYPNVHVRETIRSARTESDKKAEAPKLPWDKLRVGMSQDEVEKLLGAPKRASGTWETIKSRNSVTGQTRVVPTGGGVYEYADGGSVHFDENHLVYRWTPGR